MIKSFKLLGSILFLTVSCIAVSHADDKVSAEIYGYIKLDASYDTGQALPGDYYKQVTANSQNIGGSNQFNMTVNQSRFGVNLAGPDTAGAKLSGKFEFDFYNDDPGADNKPYPLLRLYYAEMNWEDSDFDLIFGQDYDVISPLAPSILNYFVGWNEGNDGYRRPQIRATKGVKVGSESKFITQLAVAKTIGSSTPFATTVNNNGVESEYPNAQARVAYDTKLLTDRHTVLGVYGHYGMEKYYATKDTLNSSRVVTWSVGADLTLPLMDNLTLTGEILRGANLASFLGGAGNSVQTINGVATGVHATDFWAQLNFKAQPIWQFNLGGGESKCDSGDFAATSGTALLRNDFIYINTMYNLSKPVMVGFEVTELDSQYVGIGDGRETRFQTSFQYSF